MTRWEPVHVTSLSPFTVTLTSGASVKALRIDGLTYSTTSGTYVAIVQEGSIPIVHPVIP
jgi:hypothetical protein